MAVVVLIVLQQHLSTYDRMLPSGLWHLVDEPGYQSAAGTLVEFDMSAVGDMSCEKDAANGRDHMHGKSAKVESIVHWQGERWVLLVIEL
jgi:hypothetical protein